MPSATPLLPTRADASTGSADLIFLADYLNTPHVDRRTPSEIWAALSFEDQRLAIDRVDEVCTRLRAGGRRHTPSLRTYLSERMWTLISSESSSEPDPSQPPPPLAEAPRRVRALERHAFPPATIAALPFAVPAHLARPIGQAAGRLPAANASSSPQRGNTLMLPRLSNSNPDDGSIERGKETSIVASTPMVGESGGAVAGIAATPLPATPSPHMMHARVGDFTSISSLAGRGLDQNTRLRSRLLTIRMRHARIKAWQRR